METFASMCLQEVCAEELDNLSEFFISPAGDDITEEELTSTTFTEEIDKAKENAPCLWSILYGLSNTKAQLTRNTHKKPDKVSRTQYFPMNANYVIKDCPNCLMTRQG